MEFTGNGKLWVTFRNYSKIIKPPNKCLSTSHQDGYIKLWSSEDLSIRYSANSSRNITNLKASSTRDLLAASDLNGQIHIYNTQNLRKINQLYHSTASIKSMAFSQNGSLASASDDCTIKLWSLNAGSSDSIQQFTCAKQANCIDFADGDQYMATGHKDGKIRIWSLQSRKIESEIKAASTNQSITSLVCSSMGRYIYACSKENQILKLDSRKLDGPVSILEDDNFSCAGQRTRLTLSTHKNYAVVPSSNKSVVIFDLRLEQKHSELAHNVSLIDCQWQPGQNRISALDKNGEIITWEV